MDIKDIGKRFVMLGGIRRSLDKTNELMRKLLKERASVHDSINKSIYAASAGGHLELVIYLFECGIKLYENKYFDKKIFEINDTLYKTLFDLEKNDEDIEFCRKEYYDTLSLIIKKEQKAKKYLLFSILICIFSCFLLLLE